MSEYVRASEREASLLAAAKDVLVRDGYQALTMRTVAAEADVRLSTLQYVFRTRADLVHALAEKVLADVGYTGEIGATATGLAQGLQQIADWFGDDVLADPGVRELLRAEFIINVSRHPVADSYPAGRPLLGGILNTWLQQLAAAGREEFALPLEDIEVLLVHGFLGLTYDYLRSEDLPQYHRNAAGLARTVLAVADPRPVN